MKSYLEVTCIINALMFFVSWNLSAALMHRKVKRSKVLRWSVVSALFLLFVQNVRVDLIVVLTGSLFLLKGSFTGCFESLLIHEMLYRLSGLFPDTLLYSGQVYVSQSSFIWIVLALFLMMFESIMLKVLIPLWTSSDLTLMVEITTEHERWECVGYIDTGNFCQLDNLPVIFVSHPIHSSEVIEIEGIEGKIELEAAKGWIRYGEKSLSAVIAYQKDLGMECLLHRNCL